MAEAPAEKLEAELARSGADLEQPVAFAEPCGRNDGISDLAAGFF